MNAITMTCSEARKIICADIFNSSEAFIQHRNYCPECEEYYEQQIKSTAVLKSAAEADVPEGLAERIMVEHLLNHKQQLAKRKYRWAAVAASLFLAFAVATFTSFQSKQAIAEHVLAHVHEEIELFQDKGHVTPESLNDLLKPYGVRAHDDIGHIHHAGNCTIRGEQGVHAVFAGKGERAPIILVAFPHQLEAEESLHIGDDVFKGVMMKTRKGGVALLSEDEESLEEFKGRIDASLMTFLNDVPINR